MSRESVPAGSRDEASNEGPQESSARSDESLSDETTAGASDDVEELRAERDLLQVENERLRAQYEQARQTQYRRAAFGFGVISTVALGGAVLYPAVRDVLISVAAIGAFSAVLTEYLTPERFLAASVGRQLYTTFASNVEQLLGELAAGSTRVYIPREGTDCRLFVPQSEDYTLPAADALDSVFVIPEDDTARGVSLTPVGVNLYRELTATRGVQDSEEVARLAGELRETAIESFELADQVETAVDLSAGQVTLEVTGSAFGDRPQIDDPIVSVFAVGLAVRLEEPVTVETGTLETGYTASLYWDTDDEG